MNYYRSGRPEGQSPFRKKRAPRLRRLLSRGVDFLTIVLILLAVAYNLILSSEPEIQLSSTAYHQKADYFEAAKGSFKQLRNRNKITVDEQGIISHLKKKFPEIKSGKIDLPLIGQSPKLELQIAQPVFWLNAQNVDYIVNSQGLVVARKSDLPNIKELPVVIDQSGFALKIGQQVLPASHVSFIEQLINQCRRSEITLSSVTLPPRPMEMDVRTNDRSYYIKFYLGGDSGLQIGQFLAARAEFDRNNKQPSQYLDVRVPGKVYFK